MPNQTILRRVLQIWSRKTSPIQEEILDIVKREPGLTSPHIRDRLRRRGYHGMTKKDLNRELYSLSPGRLQWREIEGGSRVWSAGESSHDGVDDGPLILSTNGAWLP